ncbi:MAG: ATP-dependent DNA ligase [Nitrospirota bacterium]
MLFRELIRYFERLEVTSKRLEMFDILAELFKRLDNKDIDKVVYLLQGRLRPSFFDIEMGMSEKLILRTIANLSSLSIKEVEKNFRTKGDIGETAEELIEEKGEDTGLSIEEVYNELFKIANISGERGVEKKIDRLKGLLSHVSNEEAKYISRFVSGRLRLGIGDSTILESLSIAKVNRGFKKELERGFNLCSDIGHVARILFERGEEGIKEIEIRVGYPIRMALCERLSSAEEIIEKIGRCSVEAKYDGFRCQIHKDGDNVEIFSRNLEKTTNMFPEIVDAVKREFRAREGIFEGEALAYNEQTGDMLPFQITMQRKRKYGIEDMAKEYPLKFFAFDLFYADGKDYRDRPYIERRDRLKQLIRGGIIDISESIEVTEPEKLMAFFDKVIKKGLEGIIAKRLDGHYSAGSRNFNWIKLKNSYRGQLSDTIDICIVGYMNGKGTRARFGVGAVLGAVYDHDEEIFKTITKIGSGFTEDELNRLKKTLDDISLTERPRRVESIITPDVWVEPKYILTVTSDEITRSPAHTCGMKGSGVGYALRFPRVEGFLRRDKNPEDATTVSEIVDMFKKQREVKISS